MITLFGLFAEIEREIIRERTKEGLAGARADGKLLGRPKGPGKSELGQYGDKEEIMVKRGTIDPLNLLLSFISLVFVPPILMEGVGDILILFLSREKVRKK